MYKGLFIGLVIVGAILIILGFQATESVQSEVSEAFTGTPSDRSVWYFVLGALALLAGGGGLLMKRP